MSDKAGSLIELAKLAATRQDERRKYEWKVSFAFWGLIIAAIAKKSSLQFVGQWVGVAVVALYALLWLRGIWVANQNDKRESRHFVAEALESLRDPNHQPSNSPPKICYRDRRFWAGFLWDWSMLFHLAVTIAVVLTFFFYN